MTGRKGKRTGEGAFLSSADTQESGPKFTPHGKRPAASRPEPAVSVPSLSSSRRTIDVPIIRPMERPGGAVETKKVEMPSAEELAKAWGLHQQSLHEQMAKKSGDAGKSASGTPPDSSSGPITRETCIMDVISDYPEVLPLLLDVGLHCIGCTLSAYDTVQTGCELHGFDQQTIDALIKAMNRVVAGKKKEADGAHKKEEAPGQKKEKGQKAEKAKKQRLPP